MKYLTLIIIFIFSSISIKAQDKQKFSDQLIGRWSITKTTTITKGKNNVSEEFASQCSTYCSEVMFVQPNIVYVNDQSDYREQYSWKLDDRMVYFSNTGTKLQFPTLEFKYEIKTIKTSPYTIELHNENKTLVLERK